MRQQLYIYAAAVGLTLPWTLFAMVLFRDRHVGERVVIGVVGGVAATITCGYLLAMWSALDLFSYCYATALVTSVLLLVRNRRDVDIGSDFSGSVSVWFVVVLLAIFAAEAVPTFSVEFPIGWDPAFHSILSRKILDSNALAKDWRPFEDIEVNYSQGLHVLVALVSRAASVEVHQTLQVMHLIVQPLASILVFLLASRLTRDWRAAVSPCCPMPSCAISAASGVTISGAACQRN